MNGFDVQSATEVSAIFRSIGRRARNFNYSLEDIFEELEHYAENYQLVANRIEKDMVDESKEV